jgi:hypothetical protein
MSIGGVGGDEHSVAIANRFVFVWGSNRACQLAAPPQITLRHQPAAVAVGGVPIDVVCGGDRT